MRTDVPGATSCVQYRSATGVTHLFGQGLHHCSAQRIGTVPLPRKVGVAFGEPVVVVAGVGPRSIHGYQSALLQGLGQSIPALPPAGGKGAGPPRLGVAEGMGIQQRPVVVRELIEQYLVARRAAKPSEHTVAAYRRDLHTVLGCMAAAQGVEAEQVELADVDAVVLRAAFADFAEERAASSVLRAWSTWNGFFQFWVAEQVVEGNPMSAVPRPRVRASSPKPLRGEDTPEQLLRALAQGARKARAPWPERDLAVLALALLTGMRSAEMLALRVESIGGRAGERRVRVLGKGGVERVLPIEVPLEALLEAYLVSRRERFGVQVKGS